MSSWQSFLKANPLPWLLEAENPSVRYYTLTEILDIPPDDLEVMAARREIMSVGDVPRLLEGQEEGGYWGAADRFYTPRYYGAVWRLMLFAELGADSNDPRITKTAEFLFEYSQDLGGGFCSRDIYHRLHPAPPEPVGIPCLTGNMVWSLIRLGYLDDPRLQKGIDWLVRYSRFDDGFVEDWPNWMPPDPKNGCWGTHTCFRGVIAHLQALAAIPPERRSPAVKATLAAGAEYLLIHHVYRHSHDLSKPIAQYEQLGFPLFGDNDLLRMLLFLTELGIHDERMQEAVDCLVRKQTKAGQWKQQHIFPKTRASGIMPVPIEEKGQPSKWVTIRAIIALKRYYG